MADLREDFINYVVKALVSNPDAVVLNRAEDEKGEFVELHVDPADMGKVIGKAGATAKSIRTLLRGVGAKDNLPPLSLKIVDPEGEAPRVAEPPLYAGDVPEEPAPAVEAEEAPAEPVEESDEHADAHARHKREAEELADFEI